MLSPQIPPSVGPLASFSDMALRSLLTPTHYALAQKVPLPEADREQWCMRLDSAIRAQNEIAVDETVCVAWEAERQRKFKETGVMPFEQEVVTVRGTEYKAEEAVKISASIRCRAHQDMQNVLSLASLLILDERAVKARSAKPVTCPVDNANVPLVETPKHGPALAESENVAAIRREREAGPTLLPPGALP